jgi:epoxyqueuosine reductase
MKSVIKAFAEKCGFPLVGVCEAGLLPEDRTLYREWLSSGCAAGMASLSKNLEQRLMEAPLLEGQKSVILCGLPYPAFGERAHISDYALLNDYHDVLKEKLAMLASLVEAEWTGTKTRGFADTAPVWEKALAKKAGLGFIGKNTLLIHARYGSRLFLGGLMTTLELEPDSAGPMVGCGECDACVRACPTGALSGKGLDARKCLSYHTIENKGEIPEAIQRHITGKIFGCSMCESVCPKNCNSLKEAALPWKRSKALATAELEELELMCGQRFRRYFGGTPVYRTGKKTLLRNIAIAIRNAGKNDYISEDGKCI